MQTPYIQGSIFLLIINDKIIIYFSYEYNKQEHLLCYVYKKKQRPQRSVVLYR